MVIGVAGSAFSVWLTRWQQFSVVPHQSISLFYISDNKVEISPVQFLCIPWFAFYLRKPGNKSIENPLLSHTCAIPSHKIGSALIVWLIFLGKKCDCSLIWKGNAQILGLGNRQFGAVCKKNVIYLIEVNGLHELLVHNFHPAAILHNRIRGSTREG